MEKIKERIDSKYFKTCVYIFLDLLALVVSSFIARGLRFDFGEIPQEYFDNLITFLVIDGALLVAVFSFYKMYLTIWSYASVIELVNAVFACFTFAVFEFLYKYIFVINMPRSFFLIQLILLTFCVGFIRFFYRIQKSVRSAFFKKQDGVRTMLVGGGEAGRIIINEVLNDPKKVNLNIVCIVDDNEQKEGKYIRTIPIVGKTRDIEYNCRKYDKNVKEQNAKLRYFLITTTQAIKHLLQK